MKRIIWIMGTNFCGSTALNLILGNTPTVMAMGELIRIETETGACNGCKATIKECSLYKLTHNLDMKDIYPIIHKTINKDYIVDSSKLPNWFTRMIKVIDKKTIKGILLFKTPEKSVASYVKHGYSVETGISSYKKHYEPLLSLCNNIDHFITNYTELFNSKSDTLQHLCNWLNIQFNPSMREYWNITNYHNLGGNVGAKSMLYDKPHHKADETYHKNHRKTFVDNSVEQYLSKTDIQKIHTDKELMNLYEKMQQRRRQ